MTLRVLIVDDELAVCRNIAAYLEDEGMLVEIAATAEQAIARADRLKTFDACIMDMRLPGIDGNQAICAIHNLAPELPFIIHTGSTNYALPPALRAIGLTEHDIVMKPLADMGVLASAIKVRTDSTRNSQQCPK